MKCLLIYGTLSGSTMTVAELIGRTLVATGLEVDVLPVENATKESLHAYNALIVGSPSWEDQGKDGQPLPEITAFLAALSPQDLTGKKVLIFGLGDVSYPHFCGAVDVIENTLKALNVTPNMESLRIDRYYSLQENEQKVKTWAERAAKILQ